MEYWLQKKTLGGWSMVTWYSDLDQATKNYKQCVGNGNSGTATGYSWRLVEATTLREALLEEVVDAPEPFQDKPKSSGWGKVAPKPSNPACNDPWANIPSSSQLEHGLSGSVWLVHHGLKKKTRVAASEVDGMMAQGYVRGGPATKFEG